MKNEQIQQEQAESDAEWLLLLLLIGTDVTFRADVGRFYVKGRSVSITTIRKYLQRIERKVGKRIVELVDQLEARKISIGAWQREFERNVTSTHILAGA